jgi:hypothetical protein
VKARVRQMDNPKLECVKFIYSRPTYAQALGEVIHDYIKHVEGATRVEQIVAQVRHDIAKAKSQGVVI